MRLTGYGDYEFVNDGYHCGLPSGWIPVVSVNPTILPRPGTYATLGIGVVGEMVIPGEFLYRGTAMTFEQAMMNLFKRLNPVDTTPRQLRGLRNDGTPVAIPAVLQISQIVNRDDANSVKVNFVAVQPYWEPINLPSTATQVFESDGLRQSMLLDVLGEFPTSPTIRVMATAQRSSTTANVGWKYRRRYTIVNTGADPIQNYPYAIDLGLTAALVANGKALSSGNDLRVVYQGKEIARSLVDWNSTSFATLTWIVIPYLAAGASITYDVLFGNANAGVPPTLTAGVDLPAFDIATAGTNRSSNVKWVYLVDRTVGNAGKGGWYLSAGDSQPTVKFSVPGAWQLSTSLVGNDDRSQQSFSTYTATGTKYQARFEARRAKAGSIVVTEHNGADGVYLRNPVGISSIRCDIRWINMAKGDTDTNPIGSLAILTRNRPGESLTDLYRNNTVQDPEATIAVATYTPAAAAKEVFFAVQPWPKDATNNLSIDAKGRNDRYINAAWYTTLEVNIQSGVLTQSTSIAWLPTELGSKLKLDLKADAIVGVTNGAALATWTDSSSTGNNAVQATGADQPIYRTNQINGLPAVEFSSNDTMAIGGLSGSSLDESGVFVVKPTALADVSRILTPNTVNGRSLEIFADGSVHLMKFGVIDIGATAAGMIVAGNVYIISYTLGATTWSIRVNGSAVAGPGAHAQTFTGGLTSVLSWADANDFDGLMGEGLVSQPAMTATEVQFSEGALAAKWGLTASLPATHPYKSLAPASETEVYEFATALRYGGGGETTGVPPYKTIRLGNYSGASGVNTPRLTAPLNKQVQVFADTRKVEQWNTGVTVAEETIPVAAVKALDVVLDGSGNTVEQQSADWMPLLPTINPLANPDFNADASSWAKTFSHANATTTLARVTAVFVTSPASLNLNTASSTVPTATQVAAVRANDFLPIGNRQSVYVGAGLWTNNANLIPRLTITFYDAAAAVISTATAASWTPPTSSWRRREFAAVVPVGAVYWAPGFDILSNASNQSGDVAIDAVAVNDTEIAVIDVSTSGLTVGASWLNRYAYA